MSDEVFSNHIGGASELTVLANIIPGYVPGRFPITFAARLRLHLRLLSALRRNGLEGKTAGVYTGPIDMLQAIQYVRWTLIDNDTRMLLSVNFDRPLEPYLRRIVDIAGPLLDTILCNCEGFVGRSSDMGFHKFESFATEHQASVELFAASRPDISVDDNDYFIQADRLLREGHVKQQQGEDFDPILEHAKLKFERPRDSLKRSAEESGLALLDQGLSILRALYDYQHLYPKTDLERPGARDDLLYHRLAERLTPGIWRRLLEGIERLGIPSPVPEADKFDFKREEIQTLNGFINVILDNPPNLGGSAGAERAAKLLAILGHYGEVRDWFGNPPEPRVAPSAKKREVGIIQGGIKEPLPQCDVAAMALFRVDDAEGGRKFLKAMEKYLWPDKQTDVHWNLSITHEGMRSLAINEDLRRQMPTAFRQGMANRAGLLGDIDMNNPNEWILPNSDWRIVDGRLCEGSGNSINLNSIDLIIQAACPADAPLHVFGEEHPLFRELQKLGKFAADNGVSLLNVEPMQRRYESSGLTRGHLGFIDGISQPKFDGTHEYKVTNPERDDVEEPDRNLLGDLLLGHAAKTDLHHSKSYETRDKEGSLKPLMDYSGSSLQDGTFQVIRKLRMDTDAFDAAGDNHVKSKIMGRTADGNPLQENCEGYHDFNYSKDPHGIVTPLQSHIRRTNPREADQPRITRRGWSYGPFNEQGGNAKADRGMFFIAYNANISEQFEVVQRWLSGGNSTGISSWHGDPLLAPGRPGGSRVFRYLEDEKTVKSVDLPKRPLSTLQWGIYAFTPSKHGLASFVKGGDPIVQNEINVQLEAETNYPEGGHRLQNVDANATLEEWKLVIEDVDDERRSEREEIWRKIRCRGGVISTNYGVLAGSAAAVEQVLKNSDNAFSVRRYWDRMRQSVGASHLGYDEPPVETESTDADEIKLDKAYRKEVKAGMYSEESRRVNPFFIQHSAEELYGHAREEALVILQDLETDQRYLPKEETANPNGRRMVSERFIYDLIARLCHRWYGFPTDGIAMGGPDTNGPHCPMDLIRGSFYVFWPHPSEQTQAASQNRSSKLTQAVVDFLDKGGAAEKGTLMHQLMHDAKCSSDNKFIAKTVVGACFGFAGPTSGSFRAALFDWVATGQLWRTQQQINDAGGFDFLNVQPLIEEKIIDSMALRAAPDILYRTAVKAIKLGQVDVQPGDRVTISLRSAAEDDPLRKRYFLFGGDYGGVNQPIHACPGRRMAVCTIMGALSAIMSFDEIKKEGPVTLRLYGDVKV